MLESYNPLNELKYEKLSAEEQKKRGILGRLVGIIADFKNPTRNGREYPEKLWDKVFKDPLMIEKIENRCVFGELGHPSDRTEIDMEKIAICLAEQPKKGSDGKLYGVFDILNTPNGKLLKTLCDYGTKVGISSRGQGDTYTDYDGTEKVDPDTYECECWDIVILPAVKEARLQYVTESINNHITLSEAIENTINQSNDTDRGIMLNTWKEIFEELETEKDENGGDSKKVNEPDTQEKEEPKEPKKDDNSNEFDVEVVDEKVKKCKKDVVCNICESNDWTEDELKKASEIMKSMGYMSFEEFKDTMDKQNKNQQQEIVDDINKAQGDDTADNNGELLIDELQSSLSENMELKKEVKDLQEKLSVGYAKENRLDGKLEAYKNAILSLTESNKSIKPLRKNISTLKENLMRKDAEIKAKSDSIGDLTIKVKTLERLQRSLKENVNESLNAKNSIAESLSITNDELRKLKSSSEKKDKKIFILSEELSSKAKTVDALKEQLSKSEDSIKSLQDKIENLELKLEFEKKSYSNRLNTVKSKNELDKSALIESYNKKQSEIEENFASSNKDLVIKYQKLEEKLNRQTSLTEKYKKMAKSAVDSYIESQASRIGVNPIEITKKLSESYTFSDIDKICEELQSYNIRMNKLPFNSKSNVRYKVTESVEPIVSKTIENSGDYVDEQLLRVAGLSN